MDLIDRTKLPLKKGDKVIYVNDNKIHTIIGYYFNKGFNNYNIDYGYVIDNVIDGGHKASSCGYDEIGRKLNLNDNTNFYVFPSSLTLIDKKKI